MNARAALGPLKLNKEKRRHPIDLGWRRFSMFGGGVYCTDSEQAVICNAFSARQSSPGLLPCAVPPSAVKELQIQPGIKSTNLFFPVTPAIEPCPNVGDPPRDGVWADDDLLRKGPGLHPVVDRGLADRDEG